MKLEDLKVAVTETPQAKELLQLLAGQQSKISLKGLYGSYTSVFINSVIETFKGNHLILLANKEDAAYFFNDFQSLNKNENNILFFPHSYKKAYQIEDIDNANVVARAEVLERINRGNNAIIVSYPQALFEKVITKKQFAKTILEIKVDTEYSIDFINELLIEYQFEKVDFVYEPGQFAVRGGIVDVFSYSNDQPYRVEFFGDDVDTIRTFDPVNQLSVAKHSRMTVVPNIQTQVSTEKRASFIEFLPKDTVIWAKDVLFTKGILDKEYQKALDIYNELADTPGKASPPSELFFEKSVFFSI